MDLHVNAKPLCLSLLECWSTASPGEWRLGVAAFSPTCRCLVYRAVLGRAAFNYVCSFIPLGCAPMRSCKLDKIISCGPQGVLCLKEPGRPPVCPRVSKIVWLRQLQVHPSWESLSRVLSLAGYCLLPLEEPWCSAQEAREKLSSLFSFPSYFFPRLLSSQLQKLRSAARPSCYTAVGQRLLKCSLCTLIAKMALMHPEQFKLD